MEAGLSTGGFELRVSWCVLSNAEERKCLDLAGNATARNIRGTLQCVRGLNTRDCIDRIKNGTADAASMFADDIYAAGLCQGLDLAAGESHNGVNGISYYVVAMARRSSSDLSLLEMHERSSCHPGMRTTVGWTVPIGYLVNTSQISVGEQCNFPKAVGNFFGYSCVPGAKDPHHDPRGNNPRNLCEACIGDEYDRHICASSHRERHYGESGALRCVAENLGDVAFVKHTTVFDNLDGKNQESWALDLELEDLKLLCPDGTEAGLEEHEHCHLAAVPTNAVVVRVEDKCRVWKFLERLQNAFGNAKEGFRLFSSAGYGESDLLFSDATHHLQRVLGSYTSWLGPTYSTMLKAFECEGKSCLPVWCKSVLFSLLYLASNRLLLMEQEEDIQCLIPPSPSSRSAFPPCHLRLSVSPSLLLSAGLYPVFSLRSTPPFSICTSSFSSDLQQLLI
ncbi:unnamed protein product [Pleuronectes platessa]|uniref:Serotransferrin n=1 Tax=Pleuronectes platessa TaxID=8262 RepID=A0A9N7TKL0_PLEPL|nr:unnamed protein product [Pleuronectes platessa]